MRRRRVSTGLGLSIDEAKNLHYGQTVYHSCYRNADGTPARFRVSGKVKTWKRDPSRVEVPLKRGMYESNHIDSSTANRWTLDEDAAFCCRSSERPAKWNLPVGDKKGLLKEQRLLEARLPHASGEGKTCIQERLVAIDEVRMKYPDLSGPSRRRRRKR